MSPYKTEPVDTVAIIAANRAAMIVKKIIDTVEVESRTKMKLPEDAHDRIIAMNTINNVFDRIDEAFRAYVHGLIRPPDQKGGLNDA